LISMRINICLHVKKDPKVRAGLIRVEVNPTSLRVFT